MVVTICRLYETYPDATRVVRDLEIAGIPSSAISIVSNNSDNWYSAKDATNLNEEAQPAGAAQSRNDVNETTRNTGRADPIDHRQGAAAKGDAETDDRLEGAAIGAAIGGTAGTAAGLVTGLGLLAIPGVGPAVGIGWLIPTLTGMVIGGVTGGLLGALMKAGVTEEDAHVYAEGVRRGGTLVAARVPEADVQRSEGIMDRSAVDIAKRRTEYRGSGWRAFKPEAAPCTADQVRSERELHLAK